MLHSQNIPVLNNSTKINNCTIKKVLAKGSKGVAYMCTDDTVLKTLRLSNKSDLDAARNEATLHSKAAEAGLAVPVLEHGMFAKQSQGTFTKQSNNSVANNQNVIKMYMIHMKRGVTLKEHLKKHPSFLTKQICQEIHKLLLALLNKGINHGDVHAENIVLYHGKLMFIDFSESKELDAKQNAQSIKRLMYEQLSNLIETFILFGLATDKTPFILFLKQYRIVYTAAFDMMQNKERILEHVKKISVRLALRNPEKLPALWQDPLVRTYCVRIMRNEGYNASDCIKKLKELAANNENAKNEKILPRQTQILHKSKQVQRNQNDNEVILLQWPGKPGHKIKKLLIPKEP